MDCAITLITPPFPHLAVMPTPNFNEITSAVGSLRATQVLLMHQPSIEERMDTGKNMRDSVPRSSHAEFVRQRGVDPLRILREQAKTRIAQLVPVRHARMLVSPFAFLRGSAAVMAADLASTPQTGFKVELCGDMHVSNFGVFASAERKLVFAINDFDECHIGPWEWDIKRLAASAYVAARHLGSEASTCDEAARAIVSSYQKRLRRYAGMGHLALWYDTIDSDTLVASLSPILHERAHALLNKARRRNHLQVLDKMTDLVDSAHQIVEQRPFIVRATHTSMGRPAHEAINMFLEAYFRTLAPDRQMLLERYSVVDAAHKVVGVGSVGTRCWVVLLQGRDAADPLFLQIKEAQASVLTPYVPAFMPSSGNQGERVVSGQRLIQGSPDIFLGWGELDGVHFYVRQLRDMKGSIDLEPGGISTKGFIEYCKLCGWALALAHAKSGDAAVLSGYIGKSGEFEDAIAQFSASYADQTVQDHATMAAAARDGKIKVAEDTGR